MEVDNVARERTATTGDHDHAITSVSLLSVDKALRNSPSAASLSLDAISPCAPSLKVQSHNRHP